MSDKYPIVYFNEYFRRKPMRLAEHENETLFTLEETDVNNFEYISMEDFKQEISKRDELLRNFIQEHDAWNKGQSYGVCFNYLTEKAKELIGSEK